MSLSRPLPGISFEVQARPVADALPRMDIPVFVGFAASGPLHLPVAVEDPEQYAMIFGGDVLLPRPRGGTEQRSAYLAPAVRAFFRNGGRRCWVVRVAGKSATANRFALPGLFEVSATGAIAPAYATARSEGTWSDAARAQTNLVSQVLRYRAYDHSAGTVDVAVTSPADVLAGDLVRVTWLEATVCFYLFVTSVEPVDDASPPGGTAGVVRLTGRSLWIDRSDASPADAGPVFSVVSKPAAAPGTTPKAERLAFDLTVRQENQPPRTVRSLGFTPEHPRYAGALPDDRALFADASQFSEASLPRYRPPAPITFTANFTGTTAAPIEGWPELWADAAQPRFPLALDPLLGTVYLPAGMTALFSPAATAAAQAATALERDGLSTFGGDLFLDANLRDALLRDVLDRADALRYEAGLQLHGIHAALGIEEATMLAAPDAVHRGWFRDSAGTIASPLASSPLAHPERWRWLDCRADPAASLPEHNSGFADCDALEPIPAPLLAATVPDGGTYTLTWDTAEEGTVELQEATRSDFAGAATIAMDSVSGTLTLYGRALGDYYYRARRLRGARTSDWSWSIAVRVAGIAGWTTYDDDGSEVPEVGTIHLAMLRMCAARGDLVALLSLPRDYDDHAAVAHAARLAAVAEPYALSYGALWHPWLIGREDDAGPLRTTPPDGATAGVMASRAIARGAWVAPANEPLRGVVALTPLLLPDARQALQDAAVNLIRQEPAGFVCLDSDTLSADDELRALNVRRLLILIRRAAIRTANDYAFEPNGSAVRNALKRSLEAMLTTIFQRGAFSGRTAAASFRVTTDDTVNTAQSVDAGRLIAEIRVAPSRPLSFLTVRLVQRGEAATAVEVR